MADSAYQDVFHNEEPQRIILAGESMSGKTTNFKHMLSHLLFLGKVKAVEVIVNHIGRIL